MESLMIARPSDTPQTSSIEKYRDDDERKGYSDDGIKTRVPRHRGQDSNAPHLQRNVRHQKHETSHRYRDT